MGSNNCALFAWIDMRFSNLGYQDVLISVARLNHSLLPSLQFRAAPITPVMQSPELLFFEIRVRYFAGDIENLPTTTYFETSVDSVGRFSHATGHATCPSEHDHPGNRH